MRQACNNCAPCSAYAYLHRAAAESSIQAVSRADKTKAKGEVPFATFDGSESGKYPSSFQLRTKGHDGAEKVGMV